MKSLRVVTNKHGIHTFKAKDGGELKVIEELPLIKIIAYDKYGRFVERCCTFHVDIIALYCEDYDSDS